MTRRCRWLFMGNKRTVLMIEPPSGKSYGFPKPCPVNWALWSWEEKKEWYIANNYPADKLRGQGGDFVASLYHKEIWRE